ncbi:hypothetical protein [Specibacter cremeus]|uniref:COG4315 family predicted lipoprotein n=1 Tax=Specibacter cremeus TaxID=1629051 RepID=UPI000F776DFE|nr:hypothetical protein [Specibacter cremeus]
MTTHTGTRWGAGRLLQLAAGAAVLIAAAAGCSQGQPSGPGTSSAPPSQSASPGMTTPETGMSTPPATGAAVLSTRQTSLGTIVVNSAGMTVYVFDNDKAGAGTSACTGPCAALWPAVTTTATGTPAVMDVTGTVGTFMRSDGTRQVTLNGLPLYTYVPDTNPGDVKGQGFTGIWWVVGPDGAKIGATSTSTSAPANNGY